MNIVFPNNITEKEKDKKLKELKVIQSILFNNELSKVKDDITVYCDENSAAHDYCIRNGINHVSLSESELY